MSCGRGLVAPRFRSTCRPCGVTGWSACDRCRAGRSFCRQSSRTTRRCRCCPTCPFPPRRTRCSSLPVWSGLRNRGWSPVDSAVCPGVLRRLHCPAASGPQPGCRRGWRLRAWLGWWRSSVSRMRRWWRLPAAPWPTARPSPPPPPPSPPKSRESCVSAPPPGTHLHSSLPKCCAIQMLSKISTQMEWNKPRLMLLLFLTPITSLVNPLHLIQTLIINQKIIQIIY